MFRGGDLLLGHFVLASTRLGHGRWSVSKEWNEENEIGITSRSNGSEFIA
jgi:hypothetical protein